LTDKIEADGLVEHISTFKRSPPKHS